VVRRLEHGLAVAQRGAVASREKSSSGQNDTGLFEMNPRDERYLPFEGSGVISEWQLQLPADPSRDERHSSASPSASQERSMSLEPHRHNSKLSTFMQSAKYFVVPVTELR
jgi:Tc toxin complex TcA C-terminal TcB-binding domain